MFRPRQCYRHKRMETCIMRVVKSFYVASRDVWKIKVEWGWCGSQHATRWTKFEEKLVVATANLKDWKRVEFDYRSPPVQLKVVTIGPNGIQKDPVGE